MSSSIPSLSAPPAYPAACQTRLRATRVAVVGGGLGGLLAARTLGQHGVRVTVFEARPQWGGRVLSNTKFSKGRITEEGAELIGSFHTTWLALARHYGLSVVSRMDEDLYERAGLKINLRLSKALTMAEALALGKRLEDRVLKPFAGLARQIVDPVEPWRHQTALAAFDISVAEGLRTFCQVDKGTEPELWSAAEFLLVNNEVARLEEMNLLGLLCKVRAAQSVRFSNDGRESDLMRYWTELEIFRCADGCQALAVALAKESEAKFKANLVRSTAVTNIALNKDRVVLGVKKVLDAERGKLADGPPAFTHYDYVVLATPPSAWWRTAISADGKDASPERAFGKLGMGPCVKFFSDVKRRFWLDDGFAPYGGTSTLGQVWEGTDNQTRVGDQGVVLSVFAGPIRGSSTAPRTPVAREFEDELKGLYRGYAPHLVKTLFRNWPNVPFIETGYASPRKGQVFSIGKRLSEVYHGRLFFAGEHTHMAFFGYMEGALRSGERAAHALMRHACELPRRDALETPRPWLVAEARS